MASKASNSKQTCAFLAQQLHINSDVFSVVREETGYAFFRELCLSSGSFGKAVQRRATVMMSTLLRASSGFVAKFRKNQKGGHDAVFDLAQSRKFSLIELMDKDQRHYLFYPLMIWDAEKARLSVFDCMSSTERRPVTTLLNLTMDYERYVYNIVRDCKVVAARFGSSTDRTRSKTGLTFALLIERASKELMVEANSDDYVTLRVLQMGLRAHHTDRHRVRAALRVILRFIRLANRLFPSAYASDYAAVDEDHKLYVVGGTATVVFLGEESLTSRLCLSSNEVQPLSWPEFVKETRALCIPQTELDVCDGALRSAATLLLYCRAVQYYDVRTDSVEVEAGFFTDVDDWASHDFSKQMYYVLPDMTAAKRDELEKNIIATGPEYFDNANQGCFSVDGKVFGFINGKKATLGDILINYSDIGIEWQRHFDLLYEIEWGEEEDEPAEEEDPNAMFLEGELMYDLVGFEQYCGGFLQPSSAREVRNGIWLRCDAGDLIPGEDNTVLYAKKHLEWRFHFEVCAIISVVVKGISLEETGKTFFETMVEMGHLTQADDCAVLRRTPDVVKVQNRRIFLYEIKTSYSRLSAQASGAEAVAEKYSLIADELRGRFEVINRVVAVSREFAAEDIRKCLATFNMVVPFDAKVLADLNKLIKLLPAVTRKLTEDEELEYRRRMTENNEKFAIFGKALKAQKDKGMTANIEDQIQLLGLISANFDEIVTKIQAKVNIRKCLDQVVDRYTSFDNEKERELLILYMDATKDESSCPSNYATFMPGINFSAERSRRGTLSRLITTYGQFTISNYLSRFGWEAEGIVPLEVGCLIAFRNILNETRDSRAPKEGGWRRKTDFSMKFKLGKKGPRAISKDELEYPSTTTKKTFFMTLFVIKCGGSINRLKEIFYSNPAKYRKVWHYQVVKFIETSSGPDDGSKKRVSKDYEAQFDALVVKLAEDKETVLSDIADILHDNTLAAVEGQNIKERTYTLGVLTALKEFFKPLMCNVLVEAVTAMCIDIKHILGSCRFRNGNLFFLESLYLERVYLIYLESEDVFHISIIDNVKRGEMLDSRGGGILFGRVSGIGNERGAILVRKAQRTTRTTLVHLLKQISVIGTMMEYRSHMETLNMESCVRFGFYSLMASLCGSLYFCNELPAMRSSLKNVMWTYKNITLTFKKKFKSGKCYTAFGRLIFKLITEKLRLIDEQMREGEKGFRVNIHKGLADYSQNSSVDLLVDSLFDTNLKIPFRAFLLQSKIADNMDPNLGAGSRAEKTSLLEVLERSLSEIRFKEDNDGFLFHENIKFDTVDDVVDQMVESLETKWDRDDDAFRKVDCRCLKILSFVNYRRKHETTAMVARKFSLLAIRTKSAWSGSPLEWTSNKAQFDFSEQKSSTRTEALVNDGHFTSVIDLVVSNIKRRFNTPDNLEACCSTVKMAIKLEPKGKAGRAFSFTDVVSNFLHELFLEWFSGMDDVELINCKGGKTKRINRFVYEDIKDMCIEGGTSHVTYGIQDGKAFSPLKNPFYDNYGFYTDIYLYFKDQGWDNLADALEFYMIKQTKWLKYFGYKMFKEPYTVERRTKSGKIVKETKYKKRFLMDVLHEAEHHPDGCTCGVCADTELLKCKNLLPQVEFNSERRTVAQHCTAVLGSKHRGESIQQFAESEFLYDLLSVPYNAMLNRENPELITLEGEIHLQTTEEATKIAKKVLKRAREKAGYLLGHRNLPSADDELDALAGVRAEQARDFYELFYDQWARKNEDTSQDKTGISQVFFETVGQELFKNHYCLPDRVLAVACSNLGAFNVCLGSTLSSTLGTIISGHHSGQPLINSLFTFALLHLQCDILWGVFGKVSDSDEFQEENLVSFNDLITPKKLKLDLPPKTEHIPMYEMVKRICASKGADPWQAPVAMGIWYYMLAAFKVESANPVLKEVADNAHRTLNKYQLSANSFFSDKYLDVKEMWSAAGFSETDFSKKLFGFSCQRSVIEDPKLIAKLEFLAGKKRSEITSEDIELVYRTDNLSGLESARVSRLRKLLSGNLGRNTKEEEQRVTDIIETSRQCKVRMRNENNDCLKKMNEFILLYPDFKTCWAFAAKNKRKKGKYSRTIPGRADGKVAHVPEVVGWYLILQVEPGQLGNLPRFSGGLDFQALRRYVFHSSLPVLEQTTAELRVMDVKFGVDIRVVTPIPNLVFALSRGLTYKDLDDQDLKVVGSKARYEFELATIKNYLDSFFPMWENASYELIIGTLIFGEKGKNIFTRDSGQQSNYFSDFRTSFPSKNITRYCDFRQIHYWSVVPSVVEAVSIINYRQAAEFISSFCRLYKDGQNAVDNVVESLKTYGIQKDLSLAEHLHTALAAEGALPTKYLIVGAAAALLFPDLPILPRVTTKYTMRDVESHQTLKRVRHGGLIYDVFEGDFSCRIEGRIRGRIVYEDGFINLYIQSENFADVSDLIYFYLANFGITIVGDLVLRGNGAHKQWIDERRVYGVTEKGGKYFVAKGRSKRFLSTVFVQTKRDFHGQSKLVEEITQIDPAHSIATLDGISSFISGSYYSGDVFKGNKKIDGLFLRLQLTRPTTFNNVKDYNTQQLVTIFQDNPNLIDNEYKQLLGRLRQWFVFEIKNFPDVDHHRTINMMVAIHMSAMPDEVPLSYIKSYFEDFCSSITRKKNELKVILFIKLIQRLEEEILLNPGSARWTERMVQTAHLGNYANSARFYAGVFALELELDDDEKYCCFSVENSHFYGTEESDFANYNPLEVDIEGGDDSDEDEEAFSVEECNTLRKYLSEEHGLSSHPIERIIGVAQDPENGLMTEFLAKGEIDPRRFLRR